MKNLILSFLMLLALSAFTQSTHTINFEPSGVGTGWTWVVSDNGNNPPLEFIANPVSGGINTSPQVAKFIARQGGANWALCYTDGDGQFTFDATNSIVKIMIYKPNISNIGMKFEGVSPAVEIQIPNTLVNQWQEITFNFSAHIGKTFNRIVIIPDFVTTPRPADRIIYFDNIQVPDGVIQGPLPEPTTVPPIPPQAQENVIAVYTEAYPTLPGTNFNPPWGQSTIVTVDYMAAGNKTLRYQNLNYQGTQYTNQDVSLYEYLHVDFWTPNATALSFFLISANPTSEKPFPLTVTTGNWVSVDIPLSFFSPPVNLSNVFQFKVVGNGTVYFDNLYFWKNPTGAGADATLSDLKVDGITVPGFAPTLLNYNVALPVGTTVVPVVTATTTNSAATHIVTAAPALPGTTSVVVTSQDLTTTLTYNVHFTIMSPEPSTAPSIPTHAAEDVISIYSDAYNNQPGTNFNPFWGQQTMVTLNYSIAGNNTLRYQGLDFQGTELVSLDVSEYENFHLDFWTSNSTSLSFFLISPGPFEKEFVLEITPETWVSVDIPLDQFSPPVNLSQVFQFKVAGNGDVWFDNWYFWKTPGGPGSDATLSDLKVDGVTIEGFSPAILNYSMVLPEGTTAVPVVTATTNDPLASHIVNNAPSLPGTTAVVVTSANGNVNKTYSINFTVAGAVPLSDYCETEVWHFGIPGEVASAIYLTITNSGTNSMFVEIESATADPVDLLIVEGGSGSVISEENFSIPGKISRTLTWAGTPPENVILNVLWSKESFLGNWQLSQANIEVPFAAVCEVIEPKPYLELNVQDNFEDDGSATVSGWKFQDANTPSNLTITEDPLNPSNNVADFNRSGNFLNTNASVVLDHRMDLTNRRRFQMKVYFPSANNYLGALTPTAAIKLQNSLLGANASTTQTEIIMPINQFDQWVTLTFNFIEAKDNEDYDQIVIQLGGEGHNIPGQFYFDDFKLLAPQTGIEANFTATPLSGYAPMTVQFTDLSTGSPTGWRWDFNGDGVIDSQIKNPTYTYETPGNYTVYLKAQTTFLSDQITKYHYINVSELVLPDYIYTDFDENVNVQLSGWPNMPSAIANPNISGINTSPTVGSWQRSGESSANIYTLLDATLNFSGSGFFLLKAHAPVACQVLFKLENSLNPTLFVERIASVTTPNQWQQLIFDFTGSQSDLYDQMIIFFDFGGNTDNTFYFDELMGPPPTGVTLYKPLLALDVQDNFEDDGYSTIPEWTFQDPGLVPLVTVADPMNVENHVAEYNRSGNFEWTNAQFILDHRMNLTERNRFEIKVLLPSTNNYTGLLTPTLAIKLQNSLLGGNAYTTQTEVKLTVTTFDAWVTLVFDFSAASVRQDYDQVVVQFGGEGHLEPGLFYFDDIQLLNVMVPIEQTIQLSSGWSGISSYVIPANDELEELFAPVADDLIIVVGQAGFYSPETGTNTLGNWESQNGYAIKMNAPAQIIFSGVEMVLQSLTIPLGWSYLPVLSNCEVSAQELMNLHSEIIMIKEIAGYNLVWPENGINTLGQLVPGKAYYILTNAGFTLTFPGCNP